MAVGRSNTGMIQLYFDQPKVKLDELKALSKEARTELGELCAEALGYQKSQIDNKWYKPEELPTAE